MNFALKKMLYSASGLVALKLLGAAANFAVVVIIAQNISVADAGLYFYIFSAILVGSVICRAGLDHYIIREVARAEGSPNKSKLAAEKVSLTLMFALAFSLSLGGVLILSLGASGSKGEEVIIAAMACLIVLFHSWANVGASVLQGQGRSFESGLAMSAGVPVVNLLLLLLAYAAGQLNLMIVVLTLLVANALTGLIALVRIRESVVYAMPKYGDLKGIIGEGKDFFFTKLLQIGYDQAPIIIVGLLLGPASTAILGVASRVSSLIGYVNTSVSRVTAPLFASHSENPEGQPKLHRLSWWLMLFGGGQLVVVVFLSFCSEEILRFFGESYVEGRYVMIGLLVNQAIVYFVTRGLMELQMTNKDVDATRVSIIRAVVFLLSVWPLAFYAELEGVVLAIMISTLVSCVLIAGYSRSER